MPTDFEPSDTETGVEELLSAERPEVVRLAETLSLAVRVEYALLRQARLRERPRVDVSVEADLAFSPIVASLTAEWLVFETEAAAVLRSRLVRASDRLREARTLLIKAHEYGPPTIRLEEEILWYSLTSPPSTEEIEIQLRKIIALLRKDSSGNRYWARWFAGRARQLPEVARATEAHSLLVFLVSAMTGGRWIDRPNHLVPSLIPQLAGLLPSQVPTATLWAGITTEGLALEPERRAGFVAIEVPLTQPIVLSVASAQPSQCVVLGRGGGAIVPITGNQVEIITAAGNGYRLRQRSPTEKVELPSRRKIKGLLTWLHLSDLHACRSRSGWDAARITETLVQDLAGLQREHGLRPDLIFFTGDAASGNLGKESGTSIEEQFREAGAFLDAVRQTFTPEVPRTDLFLVPGNHDVDRRKVSPALTQWLDGQRNLDGVVQLIQDGGFDWQLIMQRLSSYQEFLRRYDLGHLLGDPQRALWATVREIRGLRLGLAGFNSAWSCGRDGEKGRLWVAGQWQQATLREKLTGADFSLALMHHPPGWLVEYEEPGFRRELRQDFRFFLHGHEHRDWVESGADGFTTIAAGACYGRSDKESGYNLVRLELETGRGEVFLRRYDQAGGGWVSRFLHRQAPQGVHPLDLPWLRSFREPWPKGVMTAASPPAPPKVFVSYSHDSPEHMDRVLALCDRLRGDGVEAWIDQYETAPPEGWPLWCEKQVAEADFVLVVCTEAYERHFRGAEAFGTGLGIRWEGYVVRSDLYTAGPWNTKYIPVLWPPAGKEQIPLVLRGATYYDLSGVEAYKNLYRQLTRQLKAPAPPLGSRMPIPLRERRTRFFAVPEPRYEDDKTRELGEQLAAARRRLKELTIAGQDANDIREQILGLRRAMREGGRLQPGDQLGGERFHLLEIIGRGGFSIVWKAWDEDRQRYVAIKVLHGQHAGDRTRRERFFRGARKMAELHHPGIVRVIEEELEESGHHFFVMDYVGGGDLRQAVLASELPREKILPVILAVGGALTFAHERGIIHRDVKPANILLDGDRPKLTDFDLVHAFDTTGGTQSHGSLGTFLYSAPELLSDAKSAGAAADVYSLAMTAVFAFHGMDLPPDVWRRPEAFLEKLPCPRALRAALSRGISWEPEDRPGSVAELCEDLRLAAAAPAVGEERLHEVDGTVLLYVPGGKYTLGAEDIIDEAKPVHRVVLSSFWLAKYPVTNEQYGRFLGANPGAREPEHWTDKRFNQPEQPVVGVSWEEAEAYCRWSGLRLPSEAQWEAAARGLDGQRYPWGNAEPTWELANFGRRDEGTTPVGSYPQGAGPFGALDQAGNVWEWCADVWDAAAYRKREGQRDPLTTTGDPDARCVRGGSWTSDAGNLAVAFRFKYGASNRYASVGFRCVLPAGLES